jgi:hypothetical protein
MKFQLLTLTQNQVVRLVMLKTILRNYNNSSGSGGGSDDDDDDNDNNNNNNNNNKPQQKSTHRLQHVADYQPQGRNTNIHLFVNLVKDVKKSEAPHINKDSLPLSVLMFFTEIFHLLVEWTNVYYQQHLDRQAGPSC